MRKELICIVCPRGCAISAELADGEVKNISGHSCKRGEDYAKQELTAPKRTVTTTVKGEGGAILPVKTDRPILKEHVHEIMKIINNSTFRLPISVGDVIIENVFGCNIVATKNM